MSPTANSHIAEHVAQYGNVSIPRVKCPACGLMALVIESKTACCDCVIEKSPTKCKRMSNPQRKRRKPPPTEQDRILDEQNHCCFYCEQAFGTIVNSGVKVFPLAVVWDHLLPYSYSQNNHSENFVAACQVCNRFKSNKVFQTVDDARLTIMNDWESNSIRIL